MKYTTEQLQSISGDLGNIENILQQRDILLKMAKEQQEVFLEQEKRIGKVAKELIDQAKRLNIHQKMIHRIVVLLKGAKK